MNSQQLKATRGLRASIEQWARELRKAPTDTARHHVLDAIRSDMERLRLPHRQLENAELVTAVDDLHLLALAAPRITWPAFVTRLTGALQCRAADIGAPTVEA